MHKIQQLNNDYKLLEPRSTFLGTVTGYMSLFKSGLLCIIYSFVFHGTRSLGSVSLGIGVIGSN